MWFAKTWLWGSSQFLCEVCLVRTFITSPKDGTYQALQKKLFTGCPRTPLPRHLHLSTLDYVLAKNVVKNVVNVVHVVNVQHVQLDLENLENLEKCRWVWSSRGADGKPVSGRWSLGMFSLFQLPPEKWRELFWSWPSWLIFYFVSLAYVPRFIAYKLYKLDKLYFILYETLVTICLCQMSVGIHSNLQWTPRRKEHLGDLGRSWEYKTVFNHN